MLLLSQSMIKEDQGFATQQSIGNIPTIEQRHITLKHTTHPMIHVLEVTLVSFASNELLRLSVLIWREDERSVAVEVIRLELTGIHIPTVLAHSPVTVPHAVQELAIIHVQVYILLLAASVHLSLLRQSVRGVVLDLVRLSGHGA